MTKLVLVMLASLLVSSGVPSAEEKTKPPQEPARGVAVDPLLNLPVRPPDKTAPMDDRTRIESTRVAAENGSAPAQFNLGLMYRKGLGVRQNDKLAAEWYEKAAAQGHGPAQANLGFMLENGTGVQRNGSRAVQLYQKAATQGVVVAQYNLGIHYAKGEFIPKDNIRAYAWLKLAARNGSADARWDVELIGKQLAPSEMEVAKKLLQDIAQATKR